MVGAMTRLAVLMIAAATTCAAAAPARQSTAGRQVFRAGVDVTTIDATIIDRDGNPIPDLAAREIRVSVDGRPRTIVSAQFIAAAVEPKPSGDAGRRPDFSTNERAAPGRLIALVVDQGNIHPGAERSVLKAAAGYLDRLAPTDRVALFSIPAPGPFVAFTSDRARVGDALQQIVGRYQMPTVRHNIAATESLAIQDGDDDVLTKVVARECSRGDAACPQEIELEARAIAPQVTERAGQTLAALKDVFTYLQQIEGPKTVALVSEGLILGQGRFPEGIPREIERRAAQARASVYVLRLDQVFFDASESRPIGAIDHAAQTIGLETLAGATGGEIMTVVGTGAGVFDRIARETAGYYLVGIETTAADRDGKPHRIKVSVNRAHANVRARREFMVDAARSDRAVESSPKEAILAALRAPFPARGLPLRVSSYLLVGADPSKVRIVASAVVGEGFTQPEEMGVGCALFDPQGKIVSLHAGPAMLRAGADGRLRYREEFTVAPGDFTLKLATTDAAGHLGSVDRAVRARLTRVGAISVGDLVVNDARVAESGTELEVEPVVSSGRLTCVVNLTTAPGALPPGAAVRFEIVDADGRPRQSAQPALVSSEDGVRHIGRASLDASRLPAGQYLARAVVFADGGATGAVSRAFRVSR
jgi:VWFA-related protein